VRLNDAALALGSDWDHGPTEEVTWVVEPVGDQVGKHRTVLGIVHQQID
jgi:hypothetical protein